MHGHTYRKWIYITVQKKIHKRRPSEAKLPSNSSLTIKQDAPSVHLWVFMQALQEQNPRTLLSSVTCYWGYLPRLATKRPSRAVAICGFLECDLFVLHAWWCSTTFSHCSSRILERRVSGRMCTTRRTNSMAYSFPRLKSLGFLSLETSKVCCLCYRSPSQICNE
jgi:hypothetical protein